MVSRFVTKGVERFDLGDGDWVDLVTRLSFGDRAAMEQKLLSPAFRVPATEPTNEPVEKSNKPKPEVDEAEIGMHAANRELLKRAIVAWGGPGFTENGQVAPINEQTIDALDETGEKILNELRRRLVKPKPGFTPPPSPPTPTAGAEGNTESA